MRILNGDILDVKQGIIVHQVNCKKVMGAGLALQIRRRYPGHYSDFMATQPRLGDVVITRIRDDLYVAGVYGQNGYGRTGLHTDYEALAAGLKKVSALAKQTQLPVFVPFGIGCGLAGGDWARVTEVLKAVVPDCVLVKKQ